MLAHQHIRVNPRAGALADLSGRPKKRSRSRVVPEYRFPPVSPVQHIANRPGIFNASFACNAQVSYPIPRPRQERISSNDPIHKKKASPAERSSGSLNRSPECPGGTQLKARPLQIQRAHCGASLPTAKASTLLPGASFKKRPHSSTLPPPRTAFMLPDPFPLLSLLTPDETPQPEN